MQVVSDTMYQADDLVGAVGPVCGNPIRNVAGAWQVTQAVDNWSAKLEAGGNQPQFLRYYHKYYPKELWAAPSKAINRNSTSIPNSSSLITDFLAYNTTAFGQRRDVYLPRAASELDR